MSEVFFEWACPQCGSCVRISEDGLPAGSRDDARFDQIAHALCGCYVLSMADEQIGRLLVLVLSNGFEAELVE